MSGNLTYQVPEVPGPPHNGRVPIYADKASQNIGLVAVWLREVA